MIVVSQLGRYNISQRRFEVDCGEGVVVTLDWLKRDWLVVRAGEQIVLAVDWHPFDGASEIKHNVSRFMSGAWEDVLFRITKPQLSWRECRYWSKRQRRRVNRAPA